MGQHLLYPALEVETGSAHSLITLPHLPPFALCSSTMFGVGSIIVIVSTAAYQTPTSKLQEWWEKLQLSLLGAVHLAAGNVNPHPAVQVEVHLSQAELG